MHLLSTYGECFTYTARDALTINYFILFLNTQQNEFLLNNYTMTTYTHTCICAQPNPKTIKSISSHFLNLIWILNQ